MFSEAFESNLLVHTVHHHQGKITWGGLLDANLGSNKSHNKSKLVVAIQIHASTAVGSPNLIFPPISFALPLQCVAYQQHDWRVTSTIEHPFVPSSALIHLNQG